MKTGLAATSAGISAGSAAAAQTESSGQGPGRESGAEGGGRERLLLDFGWRFHLGHANDPQRDFGFGGGGSNGFQKTGNFLDAGTIAFDDADWKPIDLPHDWAVDLPFENDPGLANKGFHPLGRTYPETSVGWYRRVFEPPAADDSKRITIEFDGSYRDIMVVLNGFYICRHTGGYDPFQYDLTDFINTGGRNVLLVRVDATLSDGWFYEGAGIYRHVWLVKTNPVHVARWGTFVRSAVREGEAVLEVRTEVENHGRAPAGTRVISTIVDATGKTVAQATADRATIAKGGGHSFEQQITVAQPALWSLEQRNLYRLVTEVETARGVADRYETHAAVSVVPSPWELSAVRAGSRPLGPRLVLKAELRPV